MNRATKLYPQKMPHGAKPTKHDHRDYDFIKTKKLGGLYVFPDDYNTDVGLWMPDQDQDQDFGKFQVPSMPYGCTNYAQSDLLADQDGTLYNPTDLENITHANANGGTDLRTSFKAVVKLHPNKAFFQVRPDTDRGGVLDWFDALRVAVIVGKLENRAVSLGSPWYPEFMTPKKGIVPTPDWSLYYPKTNLSRVTWHDWNVKGWKTINGVPYLVIKPWLGSAWADSGFGYISRENFNRLMSTPGSVAYVLDKLDYAQQPQRIDSTIAQWLTSLFARIFHVSA